MVAEIGGRAGFAAAVTGTGAIVAKSKEIAVVESQKTWIELEVLHCKEAGFRPAGESEAVAWLCFDICQPKYPRRSAPITIIHTSESALSGSHEDMPASEATRRTLPDTMIGSLVVRSRAEAVSKTDNLQIGDFEYWQSWTSGDHTKEEGYNIDVEVLAEDFDRIQSWSFAGRYPSLITIYTPDITYDYIGDYRALKWAVSGTSGRAAIFDILFRYTPERLPVALLSCEEEHVKEARVEAESEQGQAIISAAENSIAISAELRAISLQLKVITSIAVAFLPVLLFAAWEHFR